MAFKRVIIRRVGPLFWLLGAMNSAKLVLLIISACAIAACTPAEQRIALENCEKLKLGMTEQQVIEVMGRPLEREISSNPPYELWLTYYSGGDFAPIVVTLDKEASGYLLNARQKPICAM